MRAEAAVVSAAAARVAGLTGAPQLLAGEHDVNARVGAHIVKLYAPGTDPAVLDLQDAALRHLAGKPAGAYVPVLVASAPADPDCGDHPGPVRVLGWFDGTVWADIGRPTPDQLRQLGRIVAEVDAALADLSHPAQDRHLLWNLTTAAEQLAHTDALVDDEQRCVVENVLRHFASSVSPRLAQLPSQLLHNDANDLNVVVGDDGAVHGLIDFGDMVRAPRICGLAIACAYATFAQPHPVRDILPLVAGYHEVSPVSEEELALLLDLVRARLATCLAMAAWQSLAQPENAHLRTSEQSAWRVLSRLEAEDDVLALARFRAACGYEPHPDHAEVTAWLASCDPAPVLGIPLAQQRIRVLDWSAGSLTSARTDVSTELEGVDVGVGGYAEDRAVYRTPAFADPDGGAPRTVHLGVDLFVDAGHPVHAVLDGVLVGCHDNAAPLDYGPVLVVEHRTPSGTPFYSLYGHLSRESLQGKQIGMPICRGEQIATVGRAEVNGGWAPHVHLQLLLDLLGRGVDVPGVAPLTELTVWRSLSPDPGLVAPLTP